MKPVDDGVDSDTDLHPMVEATRILAIRHGETDWNVATRIQGQLDIGLNATGRWQAAKLAEALAGEELQAVYSSDLSRAYDTAQAVAAASGLNVVVDTGLRERAFGTFEGSSFDEIADRWPDEALRWRRRDPDFGPAGGEVLRDFYERCVGAAERLAARHPGQHIALVAHGGVTDCLYRAAAKLDLKAPRTWKIGNASINRLLFAGGGFSMIGWSSTAHLEADASGEAPLDESSDGDKAVRE
ncbi:MAG: phosphoglycerate mutase [Rhizobacter sp.]|nr:phosphoglycerate mutase [Rhizobacter sp.]